MSTANANLTVRGIDVEVVYKDIKNLHIGVYPPAGRVRVAAPERLDEDAGPARGHPAPALDQAAAAAIAGRSAPVSAGDGQRRVPLRLGVNASASRSSSVQAAPTSKSTATACCCTCRKDQIEQTRDQGAPAVATERTSACRSTTDQHSGSR